VTLRHATKNMTNKFRHDVVSTGYFFFIKEQFYQVLNNKNKIFVNTKQKLYFYDSILDFVDVQESSDSDQRFIQLIHFVCNFLINLKKKFKHKNEIIITL
jgi:hypothetical protein